VIDEAFCQLEPLLGTKVACAAVGRSRATHYRHRKPGRTTEAKPRPAPPNKLADAEVDDILAVLRSPRFVDCSPAQVYFTLLDEGVYLASESSFYRILRSHDEVRERRRQATHPAKVRPVSLSTDSGPTAITDFGPTPVILGASGSGLP